MTFKIEGDLTAGLNQFGPKVKRGMVAAAHVTAPQIESFMKNNAPWTDQTGAARAGLGTEVNVSTNKIVIVIFHSVAYGVYLETRWGGKYAILRPGLAYGAPLFAKTLEGLIFK